jgi:glutaredoxin
MPRTEDRVIALTLYSRPGCHLCDEMKAVVARVAARIPVSLEEVDISADPDLEARYGLDIPVLTVGNRRIGKYRIGEAELLRALEARGGRARA